ncbi:histidine triad nucleotide-binding protein 3 isoform X1 [Micropterus dolomieu]|uniref:histidine triad nucleotide-binding protein 3 isoform X1 n=1 Tax=Micropterus dolomieu TaxID=147949 RepID=UPI001E8D2AAC|nr:histidine triad nucleotide-binding protein 3 isoform X1 [Micropterus dolomieu]
MRLETRQEYVFECVTNLGKETAAAHNTRTATSGATSPETHHSCIRHDKELKMACSSLMTMDEEISCFRDIKPGAPHHYLVVPNKHVGNCKSLSKEHMPLVKRMVEIGKEILQKNNVTDLSDVRFGFHWPPFCSVTHLHLHVLAPASQMGFMSRLFYRLNSYWFITADQLIELLNSKGETN